MTEQQLDALFEVKVPIFCEYIFQENLASSNVAGDGKTFYKFIVDSLAHPENSKVLETPTYSLPGFPGIKYYFDVHLGKRMYSAFSIDVDYNTYLFDVDFTCTINNNEPQHFHDTYDSHSQKECDYFFLECSDRCAGCAACKDKILFVRIEGTLTVKNVDHLSIWFSAPDEDRKLHYENDTKDFVFVVEGKEIKVHKSILIKNSTVFARMLDFEKWKETMESKIVIPEFSFEVVDFAINMLYISGMNYFDSLEKANYLMLYRFADQYDMERLKEAIKKSIVLTPFTVVEYANFLLQNNFDELIECCIDYILECSQNSLPIKDIEMVDPQIRCMFFSRTLISPVLKKDPKIEHRTIYDKDNKIFK